MSNKPSRLVSSTGQTGSSDTLEAHVRFALIGQRGPLDAHQAKALVQAIGAVGVPTWLELLANAATVEIAVSIPATYELAMQRAIRAVIDGAITVSTVTNPSDGSPTLWGVLERPKGARVAPIRSIAEWGDQDPLAGILEAVQPLAAGERLLLRYQIMPASLILRRKAQRFVTRVAPTANPHHLVSRLVLGGPREPRFTGARQHQLEGRLHEPAFAVSGTLHLSGSCLEHLESKAHSLQAVFSSWYGASFGGLSLRVQCPPVATPAVRHWRHPSSELYLTAGELASLWHLPSDQVHVPGVRFLRRPSVPLPDALRTTPGILLGLHHDRGEQHEVRLPRPDLDAGHLTFTGHTGTGKTTLLHLISRQLIASPDQPGFGLLDPHGDLVEDIAMRSIPAERERDVVLLELGDTAFPVGLPLFTPPAHMPLEQFIQTTFAVLRLIFREDWSATRMEDAVFALTATLCQVPNATLLDVPRLWKDAAFRQQALMKVEDESVLEFWADYEQLSESARRELTRPVMYRLRHFIRTPAVRNIVCQTQGVDFGQLMDEGKIVLVSLDGSAISAEADLLGELIIARLHLAALARLDRPRTQRRTFYLAVDESQHYQGASLPMLLSEGRKLGIPLLLCTQYLSGWSEQLAESVLGNVGTLITFRCSPSDSRRLAASARPFNPEHLETLSRHEAITRLQIGGETVDAVDFKTLPLDPHTPGDPATLERLRETARQRYARPRADVEAALRRPSSGRRRRKDIDEE